MEAMKTDEDRWRPVETAMVHSSLDEVYYEAVFTPC